MTAANDDVLRESIADGRSLIARGPNPRTAKVTGPFEVSATSGTGRKLKVIVSVPGFAHAPTFHDTPGGRKDARAFATGARKRLRKEGLLK